MSKKALQGFDQIQQVVIASYDNGEHAACKPQDVPDCGDGLLKFLLIELSEQEDCDSFECAVKRLDTAIRQLSQLRSVLEEKALNEER